MRRTRDFLLKLGESRRALTLVWTTSKPLTVYLVLLTATAGALPAAIAYVAAQIVDAVLANARSFQDGVAISSAPLLLLIGVEGALAALTVGVQRGLTFCQSLLRAQLSQHVNELIFRKTLTLELGQFENPEFFDKLSRAHRGASSRPLSLVMRFFSVAQSTFTLISFAALLIGFSGWALLLLALAGIPAFLAEAKFSGEAFRMFLWRSPETRMQTYLSNMFAREDHAKELKLFGLGPLFIQRHRALFDAMYAEDRRLSARRDLWGFFLGALGVVALYCSYGWIALSAVTAAITVGEMTMYLMLFRQGQATITTLLAAIGGMYEDSLYLSALHEFLDTPAPASRGVATAGPLPRDGIRFEHVSFAYPGAAHAILKDITLHIPPGSSLALVGENGSGKTTLIKLLTRLYTPTAGRVTLDGRDLQEWDADALRERIGVIFQDFVHYQLKLGENVGAGDARHFSEECRWAEAGEKALLQSVVRQLPTGYRTQLGKWFKGGRELSGGQWQKVALARAFMRTRADILVLDEPTSAMDAGAEAQVFQQFRSLTSGRIAILISHRFSTVRIADQIAVLKDGAILERGTHQELVHLAGHYAALFALQAAGYR